MHPLSFSEFYSAVGGDKHDAFDDYAFYGGMPLVLSKRNEDDKIDYLKSLFTTVYIKDIVEHRKIKREDILSLIMDLLSASVGSLTNPNKIAFSLNSRQKLKGDDCVSVNTVKSYIDSILDACLFEECRRYDVKGKNYFDYPNKYYCVDIGLRNARTGFREQEMTHIMENIVYNELRIRGFEVDVGIVGCSEINSSGRSAMKNREIDFIASKGKRKVYIQSAYAMETEDKELCII